MLKSKDSGSTWFETLLDEKVLKIIQDAATKMSPEQLTTVAIVFGVLIASTVGWKSWLNKKSKDKEVDSKNREIDADLEKTIQLSKLEKEKLEVLNQAANMIPFLSTLAESVNDLRSDLTSKLKPSDIIDISDRNLTTADDEKISFTGQQVSSLTETIREKAIEKKVEGSFLLRSADFTDKEGLNVQLRRQEDNYDFKARVPLNVLNDKDIETLKDESWNKKPMHMILLVKELHERYTSATVVSVKIDTDSNH